MSRIASYVAVSVTLALAISVAAFMSATDSEAIVTFSVNSTVDSPDINPGDGVCLSAAGGCTLRAAIMETNDLVGMDIVDVPVGVYNLTIPGTGEDDAETGDLDLTDDVKIDGASGIATVDGNDIDRVFDIDPHGTDLDVEIYDMRIQDGQAPAGFDGSGIYSGNPDTVLLIERSFFDFNTAPDEEGGGLFNVSQLTMVGVEFSGNSAEYGGGMYQDSPSSASLTNVNFIQNHADEDGGGLYVEDGPISLTNGHFTNNTAGQDGGGAFIEDGFTLMTGTFFNNTAGTNSDTGGGGGLYNATFGSTVIWTVTMDDNIADFGGAIYNVGDLALTDSTIMSNFANIHGGGLVNAGLGFVDLRNDTFTYNEAVGDGGGIANFGDLVQLNNVTVTRNTADFNQADLGEGGGVYNDPVIGVDVLITNTIIGSNNFPISSFDCSGTLLSGGYNLIGDTTGCTIAGVTTGNILNENPDLIDLQDNGGDTLTHRPAGSSPAIDAGSPVVFVVGVGPACESHDQRGITRPRDGNGDGTPVCDIGAVEVEGAGVTATPFGTPVPTGTPTPTPSPTPEPTESGTPTPVGTPTPSPTPVEEVQLIWADSNCNGDVNPTDSLVVLRADAGLASSQSSPCVPMGDVAEFDGVQLTWGDFDCNGSMSPVDSLKILQYDAGFQPAQSVDCPDFGALVTLD